MSAELWDKQMNKSWAAFGALWQFKLAFQCCSQMNWFYQAEISLHMEHRNRDRRETR